MTRTPEQTIKSLQAGLEALIGATTTVELLQIKAGLQLVPVPEEDKAASLLAINALLDLYHDQNS